MRKLFWLIFLSCLNTGAVLTMSCGIDKSRVKHVYEGLARIETYPWLGFLYYPYTFKKRFTTAVVLVTKQIALASAAEIDAMPKTDFRSRARVVLGYNCSAPGIGIRDYSYHPDFAKDTFSTLAMIQLETDHVRVELRPICRPPSHFNNQQFFAMVLSDSKYAFNRKSHT
ncbi:uncharacterized protein LOC113502974 [Trichoplusia ni]|uniref:Uncharacterized protein LOC113502974 n=1 Tax=Trichoplusia ni TaxID=7111 RepID=A0A7E5WIN0_TRINI|nr:uncharacterized protein LOC113502974 [Trichoplusia ni]